VSLENGAVKVWEIISDFWERRSYPSGFDQSDSAFKGGFMGFITYEMGLHGLEKKMVPENRGHARPDICLAWVTKSIVLDHRAGVAHVQNLKPRGSDDLWLERMTERVQRCISQIPSNTSNGHSNDHSVQHKRVSITTPQPDRYEEQVRVCQDFIAAGESYELCLTSQTTMERPRSRNDERSPWHIYQTLRNRQPAPFGSFIRLGGATMLSCSPERFMRHDSNGLCSMRPMKGTVRKSEAVSTLAQAEKILHVPKEVAENLMIVDLVRHDLHGVCGVGHVTVPDLMKVEEYATVFQMITVVNGQLPGRNGNKPRGARRSSFDSHCPYTGLDALAAALPPGSMTGAPKKRSCELLQVIEGHHERSLYSGVVGYMDVTGAGDWSVTIRTMFRWDDEEAPAENGETEPREVWRIGAGGAVTILSTPEGERDEMFTKLAGPMGVFRDAA
jgi:para-aminobenzoate synthetase